MNIRSLLLGSVAAAGLSTGGAFAADLGVLTSLDVCDNLGLSGLTISSDTNCLQITGEVKYKFTWGDYNGVGTRVATPAGDVKTIAGNSGLTTDANNDWQSRFDAWIKFVATSELDFGPAKAVLKLKQVQHRQTINEMAAGYVPAVTTGGTTSAEVLGNGIGSSDTGGVILDEAYVSIGDTTVIMAGKKGSIMNKGDDAPLSWLGLFNSEAVDAGVSWGKAVDLPDGGHVIQVVSDLGNGISIGGGLEALDQNNDADGSAGTAVGVISYAGDGISAHATFAAGGVLDGDVEDWGVHAGFAGTFDNFKVVLAGAFGSDDHGANEYWNVLAGASATFDMFTIAADFEAVDDGLGNGTDFGAGASLSATVTDTVTLNLGARWFHNEEITVGVDANSYQVAASVVAAVTKSITLTGEVGYVNDDGQTTTGDAFYGSGKVNWAPGGGYTSSLKGTVTSNNGYKIELEFKKTFE